MTGIRDRDSVALRGAPQHATVPRHSADVVLAALRSNARGGVAKDLLLYVHVPFCSSKCNFCDWVADIPVKQLRAGRGVRSSYADAVREQILRHGPHLSAMGYTPRLIYWGGGTPSKLDPEQIIAIGNAIEAAFPMESVEEYTVEASPETITRDKLEALRSVGVNRISFGVQAFDDQVLRGLGRAHSADKALDAIAMTRAAGFTNINIDLISGTPDQPPGIFERSVRLAIDNELAHVTLYAYRSDPRTVAARQVVHKHRHLVEHAEELFQSGAELLKQSGYVEGSVGYFARKPEFLAKADVYYFALKGDYMGFGAGATSVVVNHVLKNHGVDLKPFIADPTSFDVVEKIRPDAIQELTQSLLAAFLTPDGINFDDFENCMGFPFSAIRNHPVIRANLKSLERCGAKFIETEHAIRISDETRSRANTRYLLNVFSAQLYFSGAHELAGRQRAVH
jgi:coproporphyrinogen III oxidase-like Fe-S oxidoreductase